MVDLQHVADKTEAEAWKGIKQASDEHDITEFKEAVQVLTKACPEMTYTKLEKEFRKRGLNVYLIGLVSLVGPSSSVKPLKQYCSTGEKSWRYVHFCQPSRRAWQEVCCRLLLEQQGSASQHERTLAQDYRGKSQKTRRRRRSHGPRCSQMQKRMLRSNSSPVFLS